MRKPEQRLWDSMRTVAATIAFKEFAFERIENGVGAGNPDVHGIRKTKGKVFWVELKQAEIPKKPDTFVFKKSANNKCKGMRISQINWHLHFHSMNGISFILAKLSGELFLFHGNHADRINDKTISELKKIRIPVYNWIEIFNYWRHI